VVRISITELKDQPGVAFKVFSLLAKKNINIVIILQSIRPRRHEGHHLYRRKDNVADTMETLESNKELLAIRN
jgi:aspartate kinase